MYMAIDMYLLTLANVTASRFLVSLPPFTVTCHQQYSSPLGPVSPSSTRSLLTVEPRNGNKKKVNRNKKLSPKQLISTLQQIEIQKLIGNEK